MSGPVKSGSVKPDPAERSGGAHQELRALFLEDTLQDAELAITELRRNGFVFISRIVQTETGFRTALKDFVPHLIVADYSLPSFNGLVALNVAQHLLPDVPFIFLSGAIGEEKAVSLLRAGATDWVLKNHLGLLGPAVRRALREAGQRAEARRAVEALRETIDVLRHTKSSFKSRALGDLRQKLQRLVDSTPWW
jgi:DNA-binding response OmpR family regulator